MATPKAKQPFEIQADSVYVEGASTPDYPIQPKRHSFEYLRTMTHLRARTNTFQAVFRVRSLIAVSYTHLDVYKRQVCGLIIFGKGMGLMDQDWGVIHIHKITWKCFSLIYVKKRIWCGTIL